MTADRSLGLPALDGNAGLPPREARAWWRDAVVYQIYPRSFADSDGDGLGDLPGIRSRLPYLHDLGVDAVWLSPFYPSPLLDGGYDVADPRDVDPRLGTVEDLVGIVEDCHAVGMRVFIDVVPNHFSWVLAGQFHVAAKRQKAERVLGLAAAKTQNLFSHSDRKSFHAHTKGFGHDEMSELVDKNEDA